MGIAENIENVRQRIASLKSRLGIAYDITLIAVTKTHGAAVVSEALSLGINHIGENRVMEAIEKFSQIQNPTFTKHLIGHLQENKSNKACELFDSIDSVDSYKIAKKISTKCAELHKTMPVLIEVNTSGEESKFGISPDEAIDFAGQLLELPYLELRGFMTIGPLYGNEKDVRKAFASLLKIFRQALETYPSAKIDTLSMGMSGDFEMAIEEGSNQVRLGSILFGSR